MSHPRPCLTWKRGCPHTSALHVAGVRYWRPVSWQLLRLVEIFDNGLTEVCVLFLVYKNVYFPRYEGRSLALIGVVSKNEGKQDEA